MNRIIKPLLLTSAIAFAATAAADTPNVTWNSGDYFYDWNGSSIDQGAATNTVKISGKKSAYEIFGTIQFFNGVSGKQIANNTSYVYNSTLAISGDRVAYRDGYNIKLYDGASTSFVVEDSDYPYLVPRHISVTDSLVAYQLVPHADNSFAKHFYIFDGTNSYALNELAGKSASFQNDMALEGDTVVWAHYSYNGSDDSAINVWDNSSSTYSEIVLSGQELRTPDVSGDKITFSASPLSFSTSYVYIWENGVATNISAADSVIQRDPKISGDKVAFLGNTVFSGADMDVFFYDGQNTVRLTDNSLEERNVQISGNYVAWEGFDGNDFEIFVYDGNTITQVTDNNVDDSGVQVETVAETVNGLTAGSYLIKNKRTGAYLNRDYGSVDNGTNVHTWGCESCTENHWEVVALAEGGYKIVAKNAQWVGLDIDGVTNNVHLWSYWGGGANQKFDIVNAVSGLGDFYYIDPQHSSNEVIAVDVDASGNGENVTLKAQTGTYSQQWEFIAIP